MTKSRAPSAAAAKAAAEFRGWRLPPPASWRPTPASAAIMGFAYSASDKALWIRWRPSGALYRYRDVPRSIYDALLLAPSAGSLVSSRVVGSFAFDLIQGG